MKTTSADRAALPTYESLLAEIAVVERGEGWLSMCEDAGRFLVPCGELIGALADCLGSLRDGLLLKDGPLLEVCAGQGELAESLRTAGVGVAATDVELPEGVTGRVERMSADEALRRYRPTVVLGSFVPVDSGIDRMVLRFPSVRHYVVLGARIGGLFGSAALWEEDGYTAQPLDAVTQWMITRHDVRIDRRRIIRHGEAWLLSKNSARQGNASE